MNKNVIIYTFMFIFALMSVSAALVIQNPTTSLQGTTGEAVSGRFNITNTDDSATITNIELSDNHSFAVSFSENNFNLGPHGTKSIDFSVTIPTSALVGSYNGYIIADDGSGHNDSFMFQVNVLSNNKNLSYSGGVITKTSDPGVEITGTFNVFNNRNEQITALIGGSLRNDSSSLELNSQTISFAPLTSTTVTYVIPVSSNSATKAAGIYRGNITLTYNGRVLAIPMVLTINEVPSLGIQTYSTSHPLEVSLSQGEHRTTSFRIENTGNTERVKDVAISYNAADFRDSNGRQINLTFTPESNINVVSSSSISLKVVTPDDVQPGIYEGIITASNGAVSTSFKLRVEVKDFFVIKDIDLDDDKVEPGDDVEFTVKIYNNADDSDYDLDVDLDVWLSDKKTFDEDSVVEDENDDEIDDSSSFTLDAGDDYRDVRDDVEFTFRMPLDANDGDKFYVQAKAVGTDENDDEHVATFVSDAIEIKKERHKLEVYRFDLVPDEVSCQRSFVIDFGVRNKGRSNEDDVMLKIVNSDLGINIIRSLPELDRDYDDKDNKYEETFEIRIPDNVQPGTYIISYELRYDNDNEYITGTKSLVIKTCSIKQPVKQPTTTNESETQGSEKTEIAVQYTNTGEETPETSVVVPAAQAEEEKQESKLNTTFYILLGVVIVLAVVFIGLLIKVVRG